MSVRNGLVVKQRPGSRLWFFFCGRMHGCGRRKTRANILEGRTKWQATLIGSGRDKQDGEDDQQTVVVAEKGKAGVGRRVSKRDMGVLTNAGLAVSRTEIYPKYRSLAPPACTCRVFLLSSRASRNFSELFFTVTFSLRLREGRRSHSPLSPDCADTTPRPHPLSFHAHGTCLCPSWSKLPPAPLKSQYRFRVSYHHFHQSADRVTVYFLVYHYSVSAAWGCYLSDPSV